MDSTWTVIVLGSGSPIPYEDRAQSGFFLKFGDKPFLVDCGSGVLRRLGQLSDEIGFQAINDIFITHHHLDHVADLLPLLKVRWLLGERETNLYGPKGTKAFLTQLLKLYPYLDEVLRVNVLELDDGYEIELEGLKVRALKTIHHIPNLAYKFAEMVIISGDTEPFSQMGAFAEGCQLLIHECSFPDGFRVPGHSTPYALGKVLANRTIGTLVLTHFYPPACKQGEKMVKSLREAGFQGQVVLAQDLSRFQRL